MVTYVQLLVNQMMCEDLFEDISQVLTMHQ